MNQEIYNLLEEKYNQFNQLEFIASDPISIPHLFDKKEDIEISGFLVATIAWGQRKNIITNGKKMVELMDLAPYDFVMNHSENDLKRLIIFLHRTFNSTDFKFVIQSLQHIY